MDIRNFFGPPGGRKAKDVGGKGDKKESSKKGGRHRSNSGDRKVTKKENGVSQKAARKDKKRKKESTTEDEFEPEEILEKKHKPRSKKTQRIIESDSDEEPIPKKGKKHKKDAVVFIDDSDEEPEKPKKRSSLDSFVKITPAKPKLKTPEKKTPVNASDFFGGGSVQRSDRKTAVAKRKMSMEAKDSEDIDMHDDDDFAKTLEILDEEQPKKKRKESPQKLNGGDGPSLSSKLSSRMKTLEADTPEKPEKKSAILVPDTPSEKKSPLKRPSPKKSPAKHEMVFTPKKPSPQKTSPSTKKPSPSSATPKTEKTSPKKTSPGESSGTPGLNRHSSYRAYLHRDGPRALGSKEIPEGADNCLEGLTFVITGVLDSLEREEAKSLVEKYGGKVTGSISKKTSYIVVGRDAGESKLRKADQFKTHQLDEDGLLELIRTKPGKKSKYVLQAEEAAKKEKMETKRLEKKKSEENNNVPHKKDTSKPSVSKVESSPSKSTKPSSNESGESLMWVDKYKPTSTRQIIGQQGDKSNAKKLVNWLNRWHHHRAIGTKPQGKFFGGKDTDGGGHKAALLSGPPGVGKTTTATLVCKESGFSFVELNASDTRSKKSLKEVVAESLNNETLVDFMGPTKADTGGHKHCIIMDEVDGMAGNEDRGGIQELVQLIKQTKIPVICICNDRNHQKMRTLANYCFDLRFYKPRVEQIKGAMMSMIYKEGLKIAPPALNEIILGANQDVRQIIHNLCMWTATGKGLTYEQAKQDAKQAAKDFKLGPFDVCRKVFVGGDETAGMTLNDKSDLFFNDYSFVPLFVQENYTSVIPYSARGNVTKHLSALARTADSICDGDLIDRSIRSKQNWGLLPLQAMYSSVIPGELMRGSFPQMVQFPGWLGKNSSRNKTDRILQELRTHMRLQISGDLKSLNMDYLPVMRGTLTDPLVQHGGDGVRDVIELMDSYDIIKEDFDNILDVSKWPNSSDPLSKLDSKTKAAFTRTYNKEAHMTPYATGVMTKKRRGKAPIDEDDMLMDAEDRAAMAASSDEDEDDIEMDTMIKKKPAGKSKKVPETTGKGKGGAKGGGKGRGRGKGRS